MQLRIHTLSPFCRKVVAALRVRRDEVGVVEVASPFTASREALGALPLLLTEHGAYTAPAEIVACLEDRRPRLVPPAEVCAVGDLDRLLDLYLLEPAITMVTAPGSSASVRAVYTALRTLDLIEDRLSDGRRYLLGEALTLVDVTAFVGVTDVRRQGVPVPDVVDAWVRRLALHPALRETLEEADAVFAMRGALVEADVGGLKVA